jgi:RND family efflux transporter MFP subunit
VKKRILATVLALVLVAAGATLVVHKRRAIAHLPLPETPPVPVSIAHVKDGSVADTLQTLAAVQSDRSSTVAAQVAGTLLEVRGREGDRVAKGQLLARIDARVLADAVESARARLTSADEDLRKQRTIFERDKSLFASHDIPQQTFDISKAQLEASSANRVVAQRLFESAQTSRSYADVVAPYAGVITARMIEPGEIAAPGKPLFTLQVQGRVRMLSRVAQDALARLRVGGDVTFSSAGQTLAAHVSRI